MSAGLPDLVETRVPPASAMVQPCLMLRMVLLAPILLVVGAVPCPPAHPSAAGRAAAGLLLAGLLLAGLLLAGLVLAVWAWPCTSPSPSPSSAEGFQGTTPACIMPHNKQPGAKA